MTIKLVESASLGKVTGKRKWYARLIATGPGSSGYHTEEALRSTGASAWPAGTKINIDHATWDEIYARPEGSLKTLAGIVADTPEYRDDVETPGLYANIEFGEEWGPFVEQFAEFIGLSIRAEGWGDEVNENGLKMIEGYIPSVLNTVDLVTEPGARGRLLEAIESVRAPKPPVISESGTIVNDADITEEEGKRMTDEDIQKIVEALKPLFTGLQESLTPPAPVEGEEEGAPAVQDVAEALVKAELPEAARTRVYESIANGVEIDKAIESEKAYIKQLSESVKNDDSNVKQSSVAKTPRAVESWA